MKIRVAHSLGLCSQNHLGGMENCCCKTFQMEEEQRKKRGGKGFLWRQRRGRPQKAYQRGRSGEDFREFITGGRDINRATLISFLLFVQDQSATG